MNDSPVVGSEPLLRTLAPALRELEKRLRGWQTSPRRQPLTALQRAAAEGIADDLARQATALQLEQPLLIILLMGGTGVGKSTLLNALAGGIIAESSAHRPTTRDPVVYFHQSIQPHRLDPALRVCKLVAHDREPLRHKILVDTPDLDSNDPDNRRKLVALLPLADVVLYVGSQEKYHDRLGWELFLEHRRRRAFAFVLNKWDRCQHPGASGRRPDEDLLEDLRTQGFEKPLIFRTCAQYWVDRSSSPAGDQPAPATAKLADDGQREGASADGATGAATNSPPPLPGEQFLELVGWLELGLSRLEIEAIKARGVSQLLQQLEQAMRQQMPPDLAPALERVTAAWSRLIAAEAADSTEILLNTLEPHRRAIEYHFAQEHQKQFPGVMGWWLGVVNAIRFGGVGSWLKSRWLPRLPTTAERSDDQFNLGDLAQTCRQAVYELNIDSRQRALANRLLVEADAIGMPVAMLADATEAVGRIDWKAKHANSLLYALSQGERSWTQPAGWRWLVHKTLVFLAKWLPGVAIGSMAVLMLWQYLGLSGTARSFHLTDLFMPLIVVALVLFLLSVLIWLLLPLDWRTIRADFARQLRQRLESDMLAAYGPLPGNLVQDLRTERRQAEQLIHEVGEVAAWLKEREQAANIAGLYGN